MKFDFIVGNPPYQDSSHSEKKNTLWRKFVELSLNICDNDGYIGFIIPSSWMGSRSLLEKYFLKYNLLFINKDECKKYFNIGSTFSYYILKKNNYENNTEIVNKEINGEIANINININDYIFDCFPRNLSAESNSILKKIFKFPYLGIRNITTHHCVHRDRWRLIKDEEFKYPVYNTPSKLYFFNYEHIHQNIPKIIIPTTTYFRNMFYTTYGTTQSFCYYLINEEEDYNIVLNNLNNIVFDYVNECFRYANWNNVQLLKKLPKIPFDNVMDDDDIFNYFKLDNDEKNYIKRQIKWR